MTAVVHYLFIFFKKIRCNYLKRLTNISFIGGPAPKAMLLLLITRLCCCFKAVEAKYMLWTLINLQSQSHFRIRSNSMAAPCLWYLIFATAQLDELYMYMSSFFLLLSPAHWHFARTQCRRGHQITARSFYGGTWRQKKTKTNRYWLKKWR